MAPFQTRPIALLRYVGRYSNNHTAFVCIKTDTFDSNVRNSKNTNNLNNNNNNKSNNNKLTQNLFNNVNMNGDVSFVLPIELEVTQQAGIYSPLDMIDFQSVALRPNLFSNDSIFPASLVSNDLKESTLLSPFIDEETNGHLNKVFNLFLTNNGATSLEIKVYLTLFS